jgi:hypothetical protein
MVKIRGLVITGRAAGGRKCVKAHMQVRWQPARAPHTANMLPEEPLYTSHF